MICLICGFIGCFEQRTVHELKKEPSGQTANSQDEEEEIKQDAPDEAGLSPIKIARQTSTDSQLM